MIKEACHRCLERGREGHPLLALFIEEVND